MKQKRASACDFPDVVEIWERACALAFIREQPAYKVFDALLVKVNQEIFGEADAYRLRRQKFELIENRELFHCRGVVKQEAETPQTAKTLEEAISSIQMCPICGWRETQRWVELIKLCRPMVRRTLRGYPGAERDESLLKHAYIDLVCWLFCQLTLSDCASSIKKFPWELKYLKENFEVLYPDNWLPDELAQAFMQ